MAINGFQTTKWTHTNTYSFIYLESIYDHEYEYNSFLGQEYEYIYLVGEVNMGPSCA